MLKPSGELANIAKMVGDEKAFQLAVEFGELRKIYFPKRKKGKYYDRLVKIVGKVKADLLCETYASELVDISKQARAFRAIKVQDAIVLTVLGYSVESVAKQLGSTPRTIKEILKGRRLGQLNLFQKVLPIDFACESSESRAVAMGGDFSGASLREGGKGCGVGVYGGRDSQRHGVKNGGRDGKAYSEAYGGKESVTHG
jgi:hypothetical protein